MTIPMTIRMNFFRVLPTCLSCALAFVLTIPSTPLYAADRGLYLGGGVGLYTLDINNTNFDDNASVAKVIAGLRISDNLAIEGDYQKLFETKDDLFGSDAELKADAYTISIRPILPLTGFLDLYAKIGYTFYKFESKGEFLGVDIGAEESERDFTYGAGVDLHVSKRLSLRGEVTRIDIQDADINLITAALLFRF